MLYLFLVAKLLQSRLHGEKKRKRRHLNSVRLKKCNVRATQNPKLIPTVPNKSNKITFIWWLKSLPSNNSYIPQQEQKFPYVGKELFNQQTTSAYLDQIFYSK